MKIEWSGRQIIRFAHPQGAVSAKPRHYVGIISAYVRPPLPPSEHAFRLFKSYRPADYKKNTI